MTQYQRYGQRPGAAVFARAVIWIVIAIVFLAVDLNKLLRIRAAGLQPGWILWAQIVVWVLVLLFWSYSGVRALRQRKVS